MRLRRIDGCHFVKLKYYHMIYTYKGDYNYGMENTHKRSIPTD